MAIFVGNADKLTIMTSQRHEGLADAAAVATDAAADAAAVAAPAAKDNGGFLGGAIGLIESSISVIHKVRRQYREKDIHSIYKYTYIASVCIYIVNEVITANMTCTDGE